MKNLLGTLAAAALGLAIFALAMWFDSSDLKRQTRRTDIAFWLHLLAAPIIVHPILLSVTGSDAPLGAALQVILVFVCLAVVALVVDRRAILVSSLSYLAYAAGKIITAFVTIAFCRFPVILRTKAAVSSFLRLRTRLRSLSLGFGLFD